MNILSFKQYMSLKGIFLLVIFLFAAQATKFTYNYGIKDVVQFALLTILSFFCVQKYQVDFNSSIFKAFIAILFVWFISHCIFRGIPFEITALINLLVFYFYCYVVVNVYKKDLFLWIEDVIMKMTCLSIILYVIMVFIGVRNMVTLGFMEPAAVNTAAASLLLFNIPNVETYEGLGLFGLPRNCGFCWEPGRFACFICVGITLNLLRTKAKLLNNKSLYLSLLGLFTTFSTTGYMVCMAIIVSFLVFGLSKIKSVILLVVAIPLFLTIFDLPFMGDKIKKLCDSENFATESVERMLWIEESDTYITPQRFECISLDWLNFIDSPVLGYGMNSSYSFVREHMSDRIVLSNGVVKDFAQFGLILALLYNIALIRNSRKVAKMFNSKNKYALIVLYYTISVSYPFIMNILLTPMFLYSLLINENVKSNEEL